MISAVILAAGLSRRMGRPKQLLKLGDQTMLEHIVGKVLRANVSELIVVLGAHRQEIKHILSPYNIRCVQNPNFKDGLGTSVAAGAAAANSEAGGIMFVPADQPLISSESLNRLIDTFSSTGALIVRAGDGLPVIFHTSLREELMNLKGDTGGRQLMVKYPDKVVVVSSPELMSLDVDTDEDYQKVLSLWNFPNR